MDGNQYKPLVSNLDGLDNYTILQTLEAIKRYVIEHAVQGPAGPQGAPGVDGTNGTDGVGISDITFTKSATQPDPMATAFDMLITYTDNKSETQVVSLPNGIQGPQGPQGPRGYDIKDIRTDRHEEADGYTVTINEIIWEDGHQSSFDTYAKNGTDGARGLTGTGITAINSKPSYISADKTITPLEVIYSDGTTQDNITITAQNGADSGGQQYVTITGESGTFSAPEIEMLKNGAHILYQDHIFKPIDKYAADMEHNHYVNIDPIDEYSLQCKKISVTYSDGAYIYREQDVVVPPETPVDSELSLTSSNPVQNKVVTSAINIAAGTPKIYKHLISSNFLISGSSTARTMMYSFISTSPTPITQTDFINKMAQERLIIPIAPTVVLNDYFHCLRVINSPIVNVVGIHIEFGAQTVGSYFPTTSFTYFNDTVTEL